MDCLTHTTTASAISNTGSFTCAFQGSYQNGSALAWTADEGPMGIVNISVTITLKDAVTVRTYEVADMQSLQSQVVDMESGVYQSSRQPPKGTARLVMAHVNGDDYTDQSKNYGLGGTVDTTLIDSTALSTSTFSLHIDF